MAEERKPDPRLIWDLEKALDITQGSERRPLRRWMARETAESTKRKMAEHLAEVDRELRWSGERGFL